MRSINLFFVCIILILVFSTPQLYAEYYKYVDNNGNIVFTDDLSQVPKNQRPEVKSYQTIESENFPTEQPDNKMSAGDETAIEDSFETRRELLDREYAALVKKRDALLREKNLINTPKKQELYNQKVINLNKQIDSFKQKIKEFNKNIAQ